MTALLYITGYTLNYGGIALLVSFPVSLFAGWVIGGMSRD